MLIVSIPIYHRLFEFLCFSFIGISFKLGRHRSARQPAASRLHDPKRAGELNSDEHKSLVGHALVDLLGHAEAKAIKQFDLDQDQRRRLTIRSGCGPGATPT
jgi:hypothetical protein